MTNMGYLNTDASTTCRSALFHLLLLLTVGTACVAQPIIGDVQIGTRRSIPLTLESDVVQGDRFEFRLNGSIVDLPDYFKVRAAVGQSAGSLDLDVPFERRFVGTLEVASVPSQDAGARTSLGRVNLVAVPSIRSVRQPELPAPARDQAEENTIWREKDSKITIVIEGSDLLLRSAVVLGPALLEDEQIRIDTLKTTRTEAIVQLTFTGAVKPGERYIRVTNEGGASATHKIRLASVAKPALIVRERIQVEAGETRAVPLYIENVENVREILVLGPAQAQLPDGVMATIRVKNAKDQGPSDVDVTFGESAYLNSGTPRIWLRTWNAGQPYVDGGEFNRQFNVLPLKRVVKDDSIAWIDQSGVVRKNFIAARDSAYGILFFGKNFTEEDRKDARLIHASGFDTLKIDLWQAEAQPDGWTRMTARVQFPSGAQDGTYYLKSGQPLTSGESAPTFSHVVLRLANRPMELAGGRVSLLYRGVDGKADTARAFSAFGSNRDIRDVGRRSAPVAVVIDNSQYENGKQFIRVTADLYSSVHKEVVGRSVEVREVGHGRDTVAIKYLSIKNPKERVAPSDWDTVLVTVEHVREKYEPTPTVEPGFATRSILYEGLTYQIVEFDVALPPSLSVIYLDRPGVPNFFSVGATAFASFRRRGAEQSERDDLAFGAAVFVNIRPQDGSIDPATAGTIKLGLAGPIGEYRLPWKIAEKAMRLRLGFGGIVSFAGDDDRFVPMLVAGLVQ